MRSLTVVVTTPPIRLASSAKRVTRESLGALMTPRFLASRLTLAVMSIGGASVFACRGDTPTGNGPPGNGSPTVAAIIVTPSVATLVSLGETVQLSAEAQDASGNTISGKTFTWVSSNMNTAFVSSAGLVTGLASGLVTIVATTDGMEGTAAITVDQVAAQLVFAVQPTDAFAGGSISPAVEVAIQDALGNLVAGATDAVTLTIGTNPGGGMLSGTSTGSAIDGVASFSDLSINNPGAVYTLDASSAALSTASAPFEIIEFAWALVSTWESHTCGVTTTFNAYCWGADQFGQMGSSLGGVVNTIPVLVSGGLQFMSVSAGNEYTCGVTISGAAYCWGSNEFGGLGVTSVGETCSFFKTVPCSTTPVLVEGGLTFASLSAGAFHACGLASGGDAYCWGSNNVGQLGDGSNTSSNTPVLVSGGLTFISVDAEGIHTCGVTTGGSAYCWGFNGDGRLGDGSNANSNTAVLVSGGLTFASVSAGGFHTCGITSGGATYCWGRNVDGELGDGSNTDSNTPVLVSGGLSFTSLSAGFGRLTCGITSGGDAYCWGLNGSGELGDGSNANSNTPVLVSGGIPFASLSAGSAYACGVTTDGSASRTRSAANPRKAPLDHKGALRESAQTRRGVGRIAFNGDWMVLGSAENTGDATSAHHRQAYKRRPELAAVGRGQRTPWNNGSPRPVR